jgi:hypothetical protein
VVVVANYNKDGKEDDVDGCEWCLRFSKDFMTILHATCFQVSIWCKKRA